MATVTKDMYDLPELRIVRRVSRDDRMTEASSHGLKNSQTKVLTKTDVSDEVSQVSFDDGVNPDLNSQAVQINQQILQHKNFQLYGNQSSSAITTATH